MRTPLRQRAKLARAQVSYSHSYPAPVGGWNARDALAAMPPTDAVALENWYCQTSYLEIRGGYADHATGMTGNGKTLVTYNKLDGTGKMFCSTPSGVYDVTSPGAVGASVAARTDGKHQWLNFGDGTNNYLIMVNGVDAPLYYDGTTWTAVTGASSPALTGITTTELVSVNVYKGRLFFIPKDSLSFWYLAAGAAGGALTEFPLDGEAKRGGYLMAMATWTIDGGDGLEDRAVFVTSEGEVIVYEGTNPGSAAAWAKVGSFFIGKPLGRKCFTQYGGDVILLTQNGAFPLSAALQSATIDYKMALSFKIENAFTEAARRYGDTFGWRVLPFPKQSALIVNIPILENGEHEQYVMNTITKAWQKFKEWDAEDFVVFEGDLYFTTSTKVVQAWHGNVDGVNDIIAYGKTAFTYLNRKGVQKQIKMFRPVLTVNGSLNFLTDIDVDFNDTPITGTATYTAVTQALWGVALWGVNVWAVGEETVAIWTSPDEYPGFCVAGKLKITTGDLTVKWNSCDYIYELGGALG
jgi:hypothetical protein